MRCVFILFAELRIQHFLYFLVKEDLTQAFFGDMVHIESIQRFWEEVKAKQSARKKNKVYSLIQNSKIDNTMGQKAKRKQSLRKKNIV